MILNFNDFINENLIDEAIYETEMFLNEATMEVDRVGKGMPFGTVKGVKRTYNLRMEAYDDYFLFIGKPEDLQHLKDVYELEVDINEANRLIKRKYGERSRINIYEKASLRNSILLGFGNKVLTLENVKDLLSKIAESRGKQVDGKKWFRQNSKYFIESNGTFKLSSIGQKIYNRLLEMDYEERLKGSINEDNFLVEDLYTEDEILEAKRQIKRKYGQYNKVSIYEKAKMRNEIIKSVGEKIITKEQLKSIFNKVGESIGKGINGLRWFKDNSKYFCKTKNESYKLSKLGKRVFDRLNTLDYEDKMTKMTGRKFVNESEVSDLLYQNDLLDNQDFELKGNKIECSDLDVLNKIATTLDEQEIEYEVKNLTITLK